MRHAMAAALLVLAAVPAFASDWVTVPVVLDGKTEEAHVVPCEGSGEKPAPDDLLEVGGSSGIEILRSAAATLRFRRVREQLYEIGADGKETLVGLKLGGVRSGDDPPEIDPFALAPEVLAGLRGVVVESDWEERFDALFAKLDGARCFVGCGANERGDLPPLPAGLRVLRVHALHDEAPLDLAPLAAQTDLRLLEVSMGRVADFGPLAAAKGLRRLEADVHPENVATIPAIPTLRTFRLGSTSEVRDASFALRFPALERLAIGDAVWPMHVADLSAIGPLAKLRELDAQNARVEKLPRDGLPALRRAVLFGHRLSRADLGAFLAAHPDARIDHDRRASIETSAAAADGIRVSSVPGVTSASKGAATRVLWAGRGTDEVRGFLDRFVIDDPASGSICICMDVDVIDVDLLAGKDVVGTLRFREAQVAVGSASAGDLVLTDESLRRLGPWFAARGWPEYAAAAESTLQRRAARTAHDAKIAAILGEVRLVALREAMSDVAIGRALRDLAPTAEERATLGIRAYRVADGDDSPSDIDRRLRRYLRDVEEPAAVVAALDRMLASPADALAAAWYLQSVGDARRFDAGWFAKARLKAARTLLASDDPRLRAAAMRVFRELGDPATAPDLMRVLPAASADGTPVTPPTQLQVDAATLLARWCEAAALPRLRAIVAAAPGDDAAREEAMRRFEQAAAVKR